MNQEPSWITAETIERFGFQFNNSFALLEHTTCPGAKAANILVWFMKGAGFLVILFIVSIIIVAAFIIG